jgi:hypothetical protein
MKGLSKIKFGDVSEKWTHSAPVKQRSEREIALDYAIKLHANQITPNKSITETAEEFYKFLTGQKQ